MHLFINYASLLIGFLPNTPAQFGLAVDFWKLLVEAKVYALMNKCYNGISRKLRMFWCLLFLIFKSKKWKPANSDFEVYSYEKKVYSKSTTNF